MAISRHCINTLRNRTAYRNYEIVCIDNIPDSQMAWKVWLPQNADQIVDVQEQFNWSRFNNLAVEATDSEYLLFLNDDIEITQDDWLDALLEHAQRPEVGRRRAAAAVSVGQGAARRHVPRRRHRPPCVPLLPPRTSRAISAWH